MMKHTIAAALVIVSATATANAELKYTLRMELKKSATATPADPALAGLGGVVTEMILPGGSMELSVVAGEQGVRIESNKPMAGLPPGAYMLQRPDGSMLGVDPTTKTFWKSPSADVGGIQAKTTRTGEFSNVGGERVERVSFQIELPMGGPSTASGVAPLVIEGDAWVADRFKKYTAAGGKRAQGALALFQLADLGLSMRQVMRSRIFGGQEIEAVVSNVSEAPAPASLFAVPAGFKEVPGPGRIGG